MVVAHAKIVLRVEGAEVKSETLKHMLQAEIGMMLKHYYPAARSSSVAVTIEHISTSD